MDLTEKLKKFAEVVEIPESKLILDEVDWFLEEHKSHGTHEIKFDFYKGKVSAIYLYCLGDGLVHKNICSQNRRDGEDPSVIYSSRKITEIKDQKRRREA